MADTYTDDGSSTRSSGLLANDVFVKRLGELVAGLFALSIVSFLGWILATQVDYRLLRSVFPRFVEAFKLVVFIVVVSSILSVTLGTIMGLARTSSSPVTARIAKAYVEFFRGTPLLFQLFVIFFGIPRLWGIGQFPLGSWEFVLPQFDLLIAEVGGNTFSGDWRLPAAIIGLTLNHIAYVAEAIRGGVNAVPGGQLEAARSLGMSNVQSMRRVVLPQAWRNALPAIGNDQIILVKDTSLLTVIAIPEIMSVFRNINSNQLDPWTPLVWVCLFYLAVTMSMSLVITLLERRADWSSEDERSRLRGLLGSIGKGLGRRQ
ncbi:amino acid ABC transporter permease [Halobacteriales archaeon QH_2_65_14]|nr:MAG: amino acid ABC transporter permease [Halobacteriales archaeon QH_2_65_14]